MIRKPCRVAGAPVETSQVRPHETSGYSGTPLPKKLGIGPGACVLLLDAPKGFETTLSAVPEGARVTRRAAAGDVIILFAASRARLESRFPDALGALAAKGKLWIAWPKKTSGVVTDATDAVVREWGLRHGLVDFKVCAIDATWSGLCFARRKAKS